MADPKSLLHQSSVTWCSYVDGPRWSAFGKAFRDRVWADPDLELVTCEDEKSLLRTTTRFVVRGPQESVTALQHDLLQSVERWNER